MNASFIVFEGLDGAGKSTLAKMLSGELNAVYLSTPPPFLEGIREAMDEDEKISLRSRCLYYLLANSCISDIVRGLRNSRLVICDRYIHSTLSIHSLLGLKIDFASFIAELERPDISFFIFNSDEKERLQRIIQRDKNTKYDRLKEDPIFRKRYVAYFRKKGEFIFIDTAHEKPEETLAKIKQELTRKR